MKRVIFLIVCCICALSLEAKTATVISKELRGRYRNVVLLRLDDGVVAFVNRSDSKVDFATLLALDRGDQISYSIGKHGNIIIERIQNIRQATSFGGKRKGIVQDLILTGRWEGWGAIRFTDGSYGLIDRTHSCRQVLKLQQGSEVLYSIKDNLIIVYDILTL